jgi:hypothetical protein
MTEPVSAAPNPLPATKVNSSEAAQGRRILSTAFVRVGPDGLLTVQLKSGRVLLLRNVAMHPAEYCGLLMTAGQSGSKYCGSYAEVVAARPGGAPPRAEPDLAAPNPLKT